MKIPMPSVKLAQLYFTLFNFIKYLCRVSYLARMGCRSRVDSCVEVAGVILTRQSSQVSYNCVGHIFDGLKLFISIDIIESEI